MSFDLHKALGDKRARTIEGRLVADLQLSVVMDGESGKLILIGKSHCYGSLEPDNENLCTDWKVWGCDGQHLRFPSDLDLTTDE